MPQDDQLLDVDEVSGPPPGLLPAGLLLDDSKPDHGRLETLLRDIARSGLNAAGTISC